MAAVKAWKLNDKAQPSFPDDFEVQRRAVLQVTDLKNNNNKYYGIELHAVSYTHLTLPTKRIV